MNHCSLSLHSLPDLAHDAIASCLTDKDIHRMMESNQWLLEAYGGRQRKVVLYNEEDKGTGDGAIISSLLRRRPRLVHIAIKNVDLHEPIAGIVDSSHHHQLLQVLEVEIHNHQDPLTALSPLFHILGQGLYPKLQRIILKLYASMSYDPLLTALGDVALYPRKDKGCCGLRVLELYKSTTLAGTLSLRSILSSSGACDALEELRLEGSWQEDKVDDHVEEWLINTKALHLRAFAVPRIASRVIRALSTPQVAPRLQSLCLGIAESTPMMLLSNEIHRRAWPGLVEVRVKARGQEALQLMQALTVGAPGLRSLGLIGSLFGQEGGVMLARWLASGACGGLEELDLTGAGICDGGVVELVRALEGGAPCNGTLQRLNIRLNNIHPDGMREVVVSLTRGALCNLKYLNLSRNYDLAQGVVYLAEAMEGGRALPHLVELELNSVGMDDSGALALYQALRTACPCLKRLDVGYNEGISDVFKRELVEGVNHHRRPGRKVVVEG